MKLLFASLLLALGLAAVGSALAEPSPAKGPFCPRPGGSGCCATGASCQGLGCCPAHK